MLCRTTFLGGCKLSKSSLQKKIRAKGQASNPCKVGLPGLHLSFAVAGGKHKACCRRTQRLHTVARQETVPMTTSTRGCLQWAPCFQLKMMNLPPIVAGTPLMDRANKIKTASITSKCYHSWSKAAVVRMSEGCTLDSHAKTQCSISPNLEWSEVPKVRMSYFLQQIS